MNTAGVVTRVKSLFGDSNEIFINDSNIVDWINEAQLEICRETHYKVGTSTANNAQAFRTGVTLTDALLIRTITYGTTPLSLMDTETIDRMGLRELSDGIPQAYYFVGPAIYLFPKPESTDTTTVTVSYVKAPTDLTTTGSSLDIPVVYHNDLCNFIVMRAHERNENYRAAELYEAKFRASLGQRRYEGLSQDDSYRMVGPDIMDYSAYFNRP